MTILDFVLDWAIVLLVVAGMACVALAGHNMSPTVSDPLAEFNFRSGIFGPRTNFNERGRRYRRLSVRFLGAAGVALLLRVIL
jgi:hypothetical protein